MCELSDYLKDPGEEDFSLVKDIEKRAVHLLSLREHGSKELKRKLKQKFPQAESRPALVDFVLDVCRKNNWLSDERFIESYVRESIDKGHGPYKIREALSLKTDENEMLSENLALEENEWIEIARDAIIKKYGDASRPPVAKEFARRARFLQSRGFTQQQIMKAFDRN